jgi:hypothetical protein
VATTDKAYQPGLVGEQAILVSIQDPSIQFAKIQNNRLWMLSHR